MVVGVSVVCLEFTASDLFRNFMRCLKREIGVASHAGRWGIGRILSKFVAFFYIVKKL